MSSVAYEIETRQLLDREKAASDKNIIFDEEYEGVVQTLVRWHQNAQKALFWFYMQIKNDISIHPAFAFVMWLILFLQTVHFGFFNHVDFPWNATITKVFRGVTINISRFPAADGSLDEFTASTCICVSFIFFFVFAGLTARYLNWAWPIAASRIFLRLFTSLFFLPCCAGMFKMLLGCAQFSATSDEVNPFYTTVTCWQGMHILYTIVSIIVIGIALWLAVFTEGCYFDQNSNPRSPEQTVVAKTTGRGSIVSLLVRFILVALFCAVPAHSARYPFALLMMLFGVVMAIFNWTYLPIFSDVFQGLEFFTALGLVWTGFCCFLVTIFDDYQRGTAMLYYTFYPIVFVISFLLVRARYAIVESYRDHNLTEPYLFELRGRTLLRTLKRDSWIYHDPSDADDAKVRDCFLETEHIYQRGVQRFPNDTYLRTMFSCFYIYMLDNKVLAYGEAQACERSSPAFDVRFLLFFYRRLLDRGTAEAQSSEVQSYLEFKSRKEIADACVRAGAKALFQFWSELLRASPDIEILSGYGQTARQAMSRATVNYEKLLEINPNSIPVLRAFGTFMVDLLGDATRAAALFAKAEEVEEARAKTLSANMQRGDFLQRLETNLDIFDDRNAVFGVAIDRQHIGEIESVNTAGRRQFGYVQSSDLVGHNIHKIIPSPLADIHDDLLTDYLNRNESRILNTTRVAFALHKAGHIFPINLFIRWADQANGKMVGVLQAIDDTHDVHLMIDHKTRAVTYCTLPCYHLFGLSREKIIGREVAIHDILPTLLDREDLDRTERSWEQIGTKSGLACSARHIGSRFEFPVQAWIISVVIATTTITFVRLHIDEVFDEDDEDGLSNIDDLADDSPEAALRRRLSGSDDEDGARSRTTGVADGSRGRGLLAGLADDTDNTSTYSSSVAAANAAAKSALAAVAVAAAPTPAAAGGMSARSATNGLSARPNGQSARGSAGHRGGRASGGALGVSDSELAQTAAAAASGAINQHTAEMDNMTRKRRSHRRAMRAYDFGGTHSNAGTDAETESRLTGDTNGSATTGRVGRKGHKRLMRVIESENAKTEAGLSRMSRFFALLIVLVWVIAIAIFVTTTTYVGIVRRQTAYVHDVTERMSHVQTAVTHVRTLALNNDDTNDLLALPSSVMPVTTTSLRNQISTSLYDIASLVQSMPQPLDHVVTPALRALFDDPTNVVSIRLGDYIVKDFAGLTEAARTFSAYLFFTTISATPINLNRDINQHYILVNGQDAIPYAYVSASAIARRALDTEAATLLTINIILACVSVGIVVAVLLILVRPIIRHIEQGKAQVLEMFLDIPRHTRRTLRRRVYGLMKDEGEEAIDLAEATNQVAATSLYDHDDDDGHTVAGEESVVYGNAQSVVGPPPASATQRYRRMRTTTAGGASVPDEPAEINVNLAKMSHSIRNKAQEADRQPLAGGLGGPTSSNVLEDKKESKEDLERMDQQTVAESTSDRNMRILVAKYAFLIIYVMVYMIVIVVLTSQRIDQVSSMTKTVEYASRRVPVLQRSFIYIREHLFNDYDDLVTNQPLSSLISPMSFAEEARVALEKFNNFHQSVVYGNKGLGLETPPFNEIQNALLYDDACISEDVELDILLPPNYHVNCPAFMGGMLRNGLQAGLISAENYLVGLRSPEAKAVYAHLVGGPANTNYPPGSPAYISLKAVFVQLSSLLQDFVVPAMQYSSRVYSESAISHMRQFKVFRIVFLICFILLLLLLYIVVYNPIIQKLNQSARQTRAMMLVLPPDVVKIVPSVQKFITDNMQ